MHACMHACMHVCVCMYVCVYIYIYNPHLGLINGPLLICVLPNNDLVHYSFTVKKARHRLNVGQILFTIHLLSKRPGRGAWDFINGGGLLIRGGDYTYMIVHIHMYIYIYIERERGIHLSLSLYIYIYIYTHNISCMCLKSPTP